MMRDDCDDPASSVKEAGEARTGDSLASGAAAPHESAPHDMADPADTPPAAPAPRKPRVKAAQPYRAPLPEPPHATRTPLARRPWFIILLVALLLAMSPFFMIAWRLVRPDDAPPPAPIAPAGSKRAGEILADYVSRHAAMRTAHPEFTDAILRGAAFDAVLTPACLAALDKLAPPFPHPGAPASRFADLAGAADRPEAFSLLDNTERVRLAALRAEAPEDGNAARLRAAHLSRLALARARLISSDTSAAFESALDHAGKVLAELRADIPRLTPGLAADPALMRRLADESAPLPKDAAATLAAHFDEMLATSPDLALRLSRPQDAGTPPPVGFFEKLTRQERRPNAHRAKLSALLRRFGEALAAPTFAESRRILATVGERDPETSRLAGILLRDRMTDLLGGDTATAYFFIAPPGPERGFERRLLKIAALAKGDDVFGDALLLHRAASLERLVARHARLRFDAAATACALALNTRRDDAGRWPRGAENLFDGLLGTYPTDPFTDEPVIYSRKRLHLRSPGADGVDRGGLEEPEFATTLEQLWEPTVPLEPDPDPDPRAFGIRPGAFDKPVAPPWSIPKPVGDGY